MKPKVALIYHYFPHYRLPVLKRLSESDDVSFTFFSGLTTDEPIRIISPEEAQENNLTWKILKNHWIGNRILWQTGLIKLCFFGDFDAFIFLANPYFLSNWLSLLILKLRGKKTLQWGHFTLRGEKFDFIKRAYYRMADGLLLYGQHASNNLIKHGFNPATLHVIYNSLDYERQVEIRNKITPEGVDRIRRQLFTHPEFPTLVFIGRLTKPKQLQLLIDLLRDLKLAQIFFNLLIIGDGAERADLEQLAASYGLSDQIHFYGQTFDEQEIGQLLYSCELCVSPGNVGLTAMHAMAYGTPVVTHDEPKFQMPEYEAIVEGETGALYEFGSLDSLEKTVRDWFVNHGHNRETIRENCYKIIEANYTPQKQKGLIIEAIKKTLNQGKNP